MLDKMKFDPKMALEVKGSPITIHPAGHLACTKFHGNPFDCSLNISLDK